MASRASRIAAVAREIFGTLPNRGVRTGLQFLKKPLIGPYINRFYLEPIEPAARVVSSTKLIGFIVFSGTLVLFRASNFLESYHYFVKISIWLATLHFLGLLDCPFYFHCPLPSTFRRRCRRTLRSFNKGDLISWECYGREERGLRRKAQGNDQNEKCVAIAGRANLLGKKYCWA